MAASSLVLVALAAAGAYLLKQYLDSRPLDLATTTTVLAETIHTALRDADVPATNIVRKDQGLRRSKNGRALWTAHRFDVTVENRAALASVADHVREAMKQKGAHASAQHDEPGERVYSLSVAGQEFGELCIRIVEQAKPAPPHATLDELLAGTTLGPVRWVSFVQHATGRTLEACAAIVGTYDAAHGFHSALEARAAAMECTVAALPASTRLVHRFEIAAQGQPWAAVLLVEPRAVTPLALALRSAQEKLEFGALFPSLEEPEYLPLESMDALRDEKPASGDKAAVKYQGPPRVAIVVDDGGYGGAPADVIFSLDRNLTIAVLPNTPHATATAKRATELGYQLMLHMPMQDGSRGDAFPGELKITMPPETMYAIIDKAFAQVPGAVGVNNHMGSKFTSTEPAIRVFLEHVKGRVKFYFDSRTTGRSRGYETAKSLGIPTAKRDVFLDNDQTPEAIRKQFKELIDTAKRKGKAIGICHFRKVTAQVLPECVDEVKAAGIQIVPASELME